MSDKEQYEVYRQNAIEKGWPVMTYEAWLEA